MSLATLNPILPPITASNVPLELSPGMQYNASNTTYARRAEGGAGGAGGAGSGAGSGDDKPPYDWRPIKVALTSGVIKVGADKIALKEGGDLAGSASLTKGGVQAISSYLACSIRQQLQKAMPEDMLSGKDKEGKPTGLSADTMDSLVAGALYVLISKYGLGKQEKMLKSFLSSALADFVSKMIYPVDDKDKSNKSA